MEIYLVILNFTFLIKSIDVKCCRNVLICCILYVAHRQCFRLAKLTYGRRSTAYKTLFLQMLYLTAQKSSVKLSHRYYYNKYFNSNRNSNSNNNNNNNNYYYYYYYYCCCCCLLLLHKCIMYYVITEGWSEAWSS